MQLFKQKYYYNCCCEAHVHQATFLVSLFFCVVWTFFVLPLVVLSAMRYDFTTVALGIFGGIPYFMLFFGNRALQSWCYWPYLVCNALHVIFTTLFSLTLPLIMVFECISPLPKPLNQQRFMDTPFTFPIFVYVIFEAVLAFCAYVSFRCFDVVLNGFRYLEQVKDYEQGDRVPKRRIRRTMNGENIVI